MRNHHQNATYNLLYTHHRSGRDTATTGPVTVVGLLLPLVVLLLLAVSTGVGCLFQTGHAVAIGADVRTEVSLDSSLRFLGAAHRTRSVVKAGSEVHSVASWLTQTSRFSPAAFGQGLFSGIRASASSFAISIPAPKWHNEDTSSSTTTTTTRRRLVVNETALQAMSFLTDASALPASRTLQNTVCVVRASNVGSFFSNRVCVNEFAISAIAASSDVNNGLLLNFQNTPTVNAQVCDAAAAFSSKTCNVEPVGVVYCACPISTTVNTSLLATTSAPLASNSPTISRTSSFSQPMDVTYTSDLLDWDYIVTATLPPKVRTQSPTRSITPVPTVSLRKTASATIDHAATESTTTTTDTTTTLESTTTTEESTTTTEESTTTTEESTTTPGPTATTASSSSSSDGSGAPPIARSNFRPQAVDSGFIQLQLELQLQNADPSLWWMIQEEAIDGSLTNKTLGSFAAEKEAAGDAAVYVLEVDPVYIHEVLVAAYAHVGVLIRHVIINTSFPFTYVLRKDTFKYEKKIDVMTKNVAVNSTNQYTRDVKPFFCQQRVPTVGDVSQYTPEPWEKAVSSFYASTVLTTSGQPMSSFLNSLSPQSANVDRTWAVIGASTTTMFTSPFDSAISFNSTTTAGSILFAPASASLVIPSFGMYSYRWFRRYTTSKALVDSTGGDLMYRGNKTAADTDGWFYCVNDIEATADNTYIPPTTTVLTSVPSTTTTATTLSTSTTATTTATTTTTTTTATTTPTTTATTTPTTTATTTPTTTSTAETTTETTSTTETTPTTTPTTTSTTESASTTATTSTTVGSGSQGGGVGDGAEASEDDGGFNMLWLLLLLLVIPLVPICFFGAAGLRTCLMKARWEQHKQHAFSLEEGGADDKMGVGEDPELVEGMGDGNWLSKYQPTTGGTVITAAHLGGGAASHNRLKALGSGGPSDDEEDEAHNKFDPVRDYTLQQQTLRDKMERRQMRRKERLKEQRAATGEDAHLNDDDDNEEFSAAAGSSDGDGGGDARDEDGGEVEDGETSNKRRGDAGRSHDGGSTDGSSSDNSNGPATTSTRHVDPAALGGYLFKDPDADSAEVDDDESPQPARRGGASLGRVLGNREW